MKRSLCEAKKKGNELVNKMKEGMWNFSLSDRAPFSISELMREQTDEKLNKINQ